MNACLSENTVQPSIFSCTAFDLPVSSWASNVFSSVGCVNATALVTPLTLRTAMSVSGPIDDASASALMPSFNRPVLIAFNTFGLKGNLFRIASARVIRSVAGTISLTSPMR